LKFGAIAFWCWKEFQQPPTVVHSRASRGADKAMLAERARTMLFFRQ